MSQSVAPRRKKESRVSVVRTVIVSVVGVLALGLSGVGVNAAFGHEVTIVVDGEPATVNVMYGSVADVLATQQIELLARDRVTPDLGATVERGMTIEVEYARPIDLTLNGQRGTYWTYATVVSDVLNNLGLGESSLRVSVARTTPVPREGMTFSVDTGHDVVVTAGGESHDVHAFGTVGDALSHLDLNWDDDDLVTPKATTELADDMAITLVRVDEQTITRDSAIPHTTEDSADPEAFRGQVTVITEGADGILSQTIVQTLHDGQIVEEVVTAEVVSVPPVTEVTKSGTKERPVDVNVTPGSAQAIALEMVHARGWDDSEFQCLVNLWNRESGWRVNASNPSGAYGIPQALPGSKMASAGADWQTNPATQITWGLGYVAGRYGTPCGAWSSFLSQGWY